MFYDSQALRGRRGPVGNVVALWGIVFKALRVFVCFISINKSTWLHDEDGEGERIHFELRLGPAGYL